MSYDVLMRLAHHRLIVNDMTSYIDIGADTTESNLRWSNNTVITWLLRKSDGLRNERLATVELMGILFTAQPGKNYLQWCRRDPVRPTHRLC